MLMHRPQTPQPGFGSITLLQKFTPHFKILDPRLKRVCSPALPYRWLLLVFSKIQLVVYYQCCVLID